MFMIQYNIDIALKIQYLNIFNNTAILAGTYFFLNLALSASNDFANK